MYHRGEKWAGKVSQGGSVSTIGIESSAASTQSLLSIKFLSRPSWPSQSLDQRGPSVHGRPQMCSRIPNGWWHTQWPCHVVCTNVLKNPLRMTALMRRSSAARTWDSQHPPDRPAQPVRLASTSESWANRLTPAMRSKIRRPVRPSPIWSRLAHDVLLGAWHVAVRTDHRGPPAAAIGDQQIGAHPVARQRLARHFLADVVGTPHGSLDVHTRSRHGAKLIERHSLAECPAQIPAPPLTFALVTSLRIGVLPLEAEVLAVDVRSGARARRANHSCRLYQAAALLGYSSHAACCLLWPCRSLPPV